MPARPQPSRQLRVVRLHELVHARQSVHGQRRREKVQQVVRDGAGPDPLPVDHHRIGIGVALRRGVGRVDGVYREDDVRGFQVAVHERLRVEGPYERTSGWS
eukprot:31426-Pelagococcus_subviridis.AAC.5